MSTPACIILAAGEGTRLKSKYPKAVLPLCGKPLVLHALATVKETQADPVIVVIGAGADQMQTLLADCGAVIVDQAERKGTGHAVMCAEPALQGHQGDVIVTCADIPLVRPQTLTQLVRHHTTTSAAATVLTAICEDPTGYGRVVRDEEGMVRQIIEHKDADDQTRQIREINTSIYCFNTPALLAALPRITADNAQGEYYLTDVIPQLLKEGEPVAAVSAASYQEVMGINTRAQHAEAERIARDRVRQRVMAAGVMLIDPPSTFIDQDVEIGPDTVIWPGALILGRTRVGRDCVIQSNVRLEGCEVADRVQIKHGSVVTDSQIGADAQIGPFAYIHDEANISAGTCVGSYAEVARNSTDP